MRKTGGEWKGEEQGKGVRKTGRVMERGGTGKGGEETMEGEGRGEEQGKGVRKKRKKKGELRNRERK